MTWLKGNGQHRQLCCPGERSLSGNFRGIARHAGPEGRPLTDACFYPTFKAAIFASTDFSTSRSGCGSTLLGFIRSDLSLFGSLQVSQGVPSAVPAGKTVLHLKHS